MHIPFLYDTSHFVKFCRTLFRLCYVACVSVLSDDRNSTESTFQGQTWDEDACVGPHCIFKLPRTSTESHEGFKQNNGCK